jgi:hypothetical protein
MTAAAVALAAGIVIGVTAIGRQEPPVLPVFATATHGQDNFAVCTGEVEDGLDAIYFLDFLTGDLRAAVMNVRSHKFTAYYHRNIMKDLEVKDPIKNPRFLMVTGIADLQRGAGNQRLGRAVVYVAELNSGVCVAYGVPSVQTKTALGFQAAAQLLPIDRLVFRSVPVRD